MPGEKERQADLPLKNVTLSLQLWVAVATLFLSGVAGFFSIKNEISSVRSELGTDLEQVRSDLGSARQALSDEHESLRWSMSTLDSNLREDLRRYHKDIPGSQSGRFLRGVNHAPFTGEYPAKPLGIDFSPDGMILSVPGDAGVQSVFKGQAEVISCSPAKIVLADDTGWTVTHLLPSGMYKPLVKQGLIIDSGQKLWQFSDRAEKKVKLEVVVKLNGKLVNPYVLVKK